MINVWRTDRLTDGQNEQFIELLSRSLKHFLWVLIYIISEGPVVSLSTHTFLSVHDFLSGLN